MNDTPSPPPAIAPPRAIRWGRAAALALIATYLGSALVFPPEIFQPVYVPVLFIAPVLLQWWSWRAFRKESLAAGRLRFSRFWSWLWLATVMVSAFLLNTRAEWQEHGAANQRLVIGAVLWWTTCLLLILHGPFRVPGMLKFLRTALRIFAFVVAVLATLVALFYAEENWRGRRQWERFRAEWEARGVKFGLAELMPSPVPDDQNLALHPLFQPIFDYTSRTDGTRIWHDTNGMQRLSKLVTLPPEHWHSRPGWRGLPPANSTAQNRTNGVELADFTHWQKFYRLDTNFAASPPAPTPAREVLRYLARHEPVIALLDEALARPHCRFPLKVSDESPGLPLPHLPELRKITSLLALRATARLEAGQPDDALRDVERAWRLCDALETEPILISQLVQIAMQSTTVGTVAHGTAGHRWEERHLRRLDELLRGPNKLRNWEFGIRSEAALMAQELAKLERDRDYAEKTGERIVEAEWQPGDPRLGVRLAIGLWAISIAPQGWFYQSLARDATALLGGQPASFVEVERRRVSWPLHPSIPPRIWFDSIWPLQGSHDRSRTTAAKCVRLQTSIDHARLAGALERHWLRHRAYPEQLDALVPEFLGRIPHDLFDGRPTRYRREGAQGFVLWSIGFDGRDDNAAPLGNDESGDLVWRQPVPREDQSELPSGHRRITEGQR